MDPISTEAKQGIIRAKQRIRDVENREKARKAVRKLVQEQELQLTSLRKVIDKGEHFYVNGEYKQALMEWEKALSELKK